MKISPDIDKAGARDGLRVSGDSLSRKNSNVKTTSTTSRKNIGKSTIKK
ncbi:hypothetical protein K9M48_01970 [Candidatus Gracilibacteria bacterium]|nr:hypothetical protein [Candidatus Gracilibacteria bacterium]